MVTQIQLKYQENINLKKTFFFIVINKNYLYICTRLATINKIII